MTIRLMTYKDISALTGISVAALKKRKERGQLPEPDLAPSQRSVLWYDTTINDWIRSNHDQTT